LKPYSAYKDSGVAWLGKVPMHWDIRPLFSAYNSKSVKNLGMIEKTVLSLSYGQIIVKPEEKLHGLVPESFETYQIVDPGNIIIRTTDLQNDKVSLRVGMVRDRGIITSAYLCLQVKQGLLKDYGYLLLNTYDLLKIFYGYGSGLRQNLDFTHIRRMLVLVPPSEEQTTIATFLDYADRRIRRYIRSKQKLIKLLEEQKQVMINEDVPEHWNVKRIRYLVDVHGSGIQMGPFGSSLTELFYEDTGFKLYGQENTISGDFVKGRRWLGVEQYQALKKYEIKPGDVVLTRKGSIGQCRLVPDGIQVGIADSDTIRVRPDSRQLDSGFFVLLLHDATYVQRQVIASRRGAVLSGLNTMTIANLCLAIPPKEEQNLLRKEISDRGNELERTTENAIKEISFLREFRTSLIADVVTGKLDVREAAAQLPTEINDLESPDEDLDEPDIDIEDELDPDATPEDDTA
jgi:type I restriction enzyme, S subunit